MALKVCNQPGCPELVSPTARGGRCAAHRREAERARGTRQQRGYDARYDAHRRGEARRVAKGDVTCWSCNKRISPLEAWDDGHCEVDRTVIHGAQCVRCNRDTSVVGCAHPSHDDPNISPRA